MGSITLLSLSISCICLAMLTLAHQGSSSATNINNQEWPEKANVIACRAAYITLGDCYLAALREFRTRQARILMGPECCKAAEALNFGCWPKVIGPFNPFFPPVLQSYCSAYHNRPPTTPFGAARVVEPLDTGRNQASEDDSVDILASPSKGV